MIFRIIIISTFCISSCGCKRQNNDSEIQAERRAQENNSVISYVYEETENIPIIMNAKKWEVQRELMLSRKYQEAIQLLPEVIEEAECRFDNKEEKLEFIHLLYTYLYVMIGKDDEAIAKSDEIFYNNIDLNHTCFSRITRIAVLSRHGRSDEIIRESRKILSIPGIDSHYQLLSFAYLTMAYLIKEDIDNGKYYICRLHECFSNMSIQDDEKDKAEYVRKMIDLITYYYEHLRTTHYLRYCKSMPFHPTRKNRDRGDKRILFGLDCGVEIVSKKDGSIFTYDDLKAILDKEAKKPLLDPFMEEIKRSHE